MESARYTDSTHISTKEPQRLSTPINATDMEVIHPTMKVKTWRKQETILSNMSINFWDVIDEI